jgi:hypothetical protein
VAAPWASLPLRSVVHVVRCIVAAEHSHVMLDGAEAELSESRHATAATAAPKPPPPGTAAVRLNGRAGPLPARWRLVLFVLSLLCVALLGAAAYALFVKGGGAMAAVPSGMHKVAVPGWQSHTYAAAQ